MEYPILFSNNLIEQATVLAQAEGEEGPPVIRFSAPLFTPDKLNRNGWLIEADAMDTTAYMQNPVVLYSHDSYRGLPIGRTTEIKQRANGKTLHALMELDSEDAFAQEVGGKIQRGFIKGTSLAYQVMKAERIEDEKLRDQYWFPMRIQKAEMMENSVVPIPADRGSIIKQSLEIIKRDILKPKRSFWAMGIDWLKE